MIRLGGQDAAIVPLSDLRRRDGWVVLLDPAGNEFCMTRSAAERQSANPRGPEFLDRDAANVTKWFVSHGLGHVRPGSEELPRLLHAEARLL